MPSTTFFDLAPEKQEKLLTAAVREFTERPYHEASINQIIRNAEIPRGSFYMYFRDKEELFRYLVQENFAELLMVFRELLLGKGGDVFAALPEMYGYLRAHRNGDASLGGLGMMAAIAARNGGLQKGELLELIDSDQILEPVKESVNTDLLDLQQAGDLDCIMRTLLILIVPVMYNALRPDGEPGGQEELERVLHILQRGMGAKHIAAEDR